MNEGIAVYLNIDPSEETANEELIMRIDSLLLDYGIKYTGISNLYTAADPATRDHMVYAARQALRDAEWMKGKLAGVPILSQTDICRLDKILLDCMMPPRPGKLEYYEEYYRLSGRLAHGILVDENRQLRDGYTSYILSRKYGIRPVIYEALADQPVRKIVQGRHVEPDGDTWKFKTEKPYCWAYTLRAPVVPGDILKVSTKKGVDFMVVEQIDYVTGKEFCEEHSPVIKHMKKRMENMARSKMS